MVDHRKICCLMCTRYKDCTNPSCRCHWYEDSIYKGAQPTKMKNPEFEACLREMSAIHEKKNQDYSDNVNPYSNFEYAARVAEPFTNPVDRIFVTLLAVKLARLAELRKEGRVPANESIMDSFKDFATYATIWWSRAAHLVVLQAEADKALQNFREQ